MARVNLSRYDERVRNLLDFSIYLDISDDVKFAWKIQVRMFTTFWTLLRHVLLRHPFITNVGKVFGYSSIWDNFKMFWIFTVLLLATSHYVCTENSFLFLNSVIWLREVTVWKALKPALLPASPTLMPSLVYSRLTLFGLSFFCLHMPLLQRSVTLLN